MVLPVGILTISLILIFAGARGQSISDIVNGVEKPAEPDDPNNYGAVGKGADNTVEPGASNYGAVGKGADTTDSPALLPPRSLTRVAPISIDGYSVAGWIGEIVLWARKNGWSGRVTSGIRSDAQQRQACINVCGNPNGCPGRCAQPGTSNHKGTVFPFGAVDVSNYSEFAAVMNKYPGGAPLINRLGAADPVHFSRTGH